ncbi:MAG: hypothetical protein HY902_14455 [Deltaproteobacteria bacterium]|nr:hypothetical protein [Deltaproteobacteria bacterium]
MNLRNLSLAAALLLAAVASGIGIDRALATGAPTQAPLTYAGTLTDQDGKPYASAQDVTLKLYDAVSGGTQKCAAGTVQAEANTGNFQVTLPPDCVQAVRDQSELWTELTVGATKTVLPRTKLGAVPYALEADTAKVAGSAAAASGALKTQVDGIQTKVDGLVAGGGSGGPWLVDANGVKLGHFQWLTPGAGIVLTAKGYGVPMSMDGAQLAAGAAGFPNFEKLYFESKDCTGPGYAYINWTAPYAVMVARYFAATSSYWAANVAPGQPWPKIGKTLTAGSVSIPEGGCSAVSEFVSGINSVISLSPTQVGLPDKIVGPLNYVP